MVMIQRYRHKGKCLFSNLRNIFETNNKAIKMLKIISWGNARREERQSVRIASIGRKNDAVLASLHPVGDASLQDAKGKWYAAFSTDRCIPTGCGGYENATLQAAPPQTSFLPNLYFNKTTTVATPCRQARNVGGDKGNINKLNNNKLCGNF
jgi:hypothetical protein